MALGLAPGGRNSAYSSIAPSFSRLKTSSRLPLPVASPEPLPPTVSLVVP
jgi:hypothetical protein